MIRNQLSSAYREAGSPVPPADAWTHWLGVALAEARGLAKAGSSVDAASLLSELRAELDLPPDPEFLLVEARMWLRSNRPAQSREVLTLLLRHVPTNIPALRLRARVLARQGDLRGAIVDGLQVLDAAPDADLVQSTLVRQQLVGDWVGAHALLQRMRSVIPEVEDAASAAEAELGSDASAAEIVALTIKPAHRRLDDDASPAERAAAMPGLLDDVEAEPDNPKHWERLGVAQLADGRAGDAVESFERFAALDPLAEEAWFGLASALHAGGHPHEAVAAADRALALNPDSHRARMIRTQVAAASTAGVWTVTERDDRHRLVMETKDHNITGSLAGLLDDRSDHREAAAMRALAGQPAAATPIAEPTGCVDGLVVYTVITGGYEQPSDPRDVLGTDADVVVLTDDIAALPEVMQPIARRLEVDAPPQLASRHPKMLPHRYFPDHERSIYIDANFHLLRDLRPLASGLSEASPMTVLAHSERATPLAEARLVVERGFATWAEVRTHFDAQRASGFDPAVSPLTYGGFLARQHGNEAVVRAMETWWASFESGVRRDQLSLDHALWSGEVTVNRLSLNNHRNDYWVRIPHA